MPVEVIITIATLIIVILTLLMSWLALTLLIRVVKASLIAAIGLAAILILLQLVFGLSPFELWQYITQGFQNMTQNLQNLIRNFQDILRFVTTR
jgi:predicted PurR-regulated permease PerM